jgi:hypothetical protein
MAVQLPYLPSNKNVSALFEKIASAKVPDKFTHNFLQTTIGLKNTNDRALIPLLRNLGFLDQSGTPTPTYNFLKGEKREVAIGDGVRRAYSPLFDADHNAYQLSGDKLKSLIAQVAGTDDDMTSRIASTFSALSRIGNFNSTALKNIETEIPAKPSPEEDEQEAKPDSANRPRGLRTEFHYNIQIQLPSNGTEETYQNIFNALRKTFQ